MIVTIEVQVADTPCEATIDTASKTVVEVTAGDDPAFADLKVAQAMELEERAAVEIEEATGWVRDEDGAWTHNPGRRTGPTAPAISGRRPISRDPMMDQAIIGLWAAGRLKAAGLGRAA